MLVGIESSCVSDIGAIKVAKEIYACTQRDNPQILFPDECLDFSWISESLATGLTKDLE